MRAQPKKHAIPELEKIKEDLPVLFGKFSTFKLLEEVPMAERLFTEWSSRYNSKMYCLAPYKPISKLFAKFDEE